MSDEEARRVYAAARFGEAVTMGESPGVLVVDFSCGFTDTDGGFWTWRGPRDCR